MTTVGAVRERAAGERRVCLVPDAIGRLTSMGIEVLVEAGAGEGARIPDQAYEKAGARVLPTADAVYESADVIACVGPPDVPLRAGQMLVGMLDPLRRPQQDRKSTRLNSSHVRISYAVFCLKKKK